ncbi:MAG: OadG family transporter subunit [Bacteroidia bacterium]|nr:OadG family transporter subunit [Bacteroidia bacterium]
MLIITADDLILSAFGYVVVFLVLLLLYLVFQNLPKLLGSITYVQDKAIGMRDMWKKNKTEETESHGEVLTGETCAAIAMALNLHLYEVHDEEALTLTIHKMSKTYSPWNSKIYGVMNQPKG